MKKILLVILIVASVLRFVGARPGFNQFHSDQGISYSAATSMIKNGNLDPLRYDYAALVPDINYVFFRIFFIPLRWGYYYISHTPEILDGKIHIPIAPLEKQRIFQVFVLGEREINAIFWSRYVTALFGVGAVYLTYFLGKKLFGEEVGLIAAFLLTFNFKHVINSHFGLPDIYNSFFLLLTLIIAVNIWKKPTSLNYLLGGIAAGLSFSTKYQIFAVFPVIVAHIYQSFEGKKLDLGKLFNFKIFLTVFSFVLMFLLTNPYFFIHFDEALSSVAAVSKKYGMGTNKINLYPIWYLYSIDLGLPQFLSVIAGFFISLKKRLKETLFLLSVVVPFSFVFFYYSSGGFYIRNLITISPILIIFAAYFAWKVIDFLRKRSTFPFFTLSLTAFLVFLVFIPAKNSIIGSYFYTKEWPYVQMANWIKENFKTEDIIAAHPFDAVQVGLGKNRTEFEIAGNFSMAEHREAGAKYALLNLYWAGNPFYFWMSFGFDDVDKYLQKPWKMMRNSFHGVAAEEMLRYQIHSVTKPWQASDQSLILLKIPQKLDIDLEPTLRFNFGNNMEGWEEQRSTNISSPSFMFDKEIGKTDTGSIVFRPGGDTTPATRVASPFIEIKPEYYYLVRGNLLTDRVYPARERDGFIRIDFYKDDGDFSEVGIISSVSSRVYDTSDWSQKEVFEVAPKNAKFMTISFGMYNFVRGPVWLDDVTVFESKGQVKELNSELPYVKKRINLNLLYPNSHGNL